MTECNLKQVFLYLPLSVLKKERILHNGHAFPMISFGVDNIEGYENIYNAVDIALQTGYRSFDCSPFPKQEENLGEALRELLPKHNLERKDILITDKIFSKDYGIENASEAFWRSCKNLNVSYLDSFLMQWPGGNNLNPDDEENIYIREETWKELVKLYLSGAIKNIGVCNFTVKHLEHLLSFSAVPPSINQVEFHPKFPQLELLDFCKDKNILMQAISFKDTFHPLLINDETIKRVAKTLKKTPTQVILKWIINKGVAVISQSENPQKIWQNFQLFDFVMEKPDMDAINSINVREKYLCNSFCIF